MKTSVFRRIIAMILVCTLLTGQFMIDKAFAMDGLVMVDGNGNVITGDSQNNNGGDQGNAGDQGDAGDQENPEDQLEQDADQDGDGQLLTGMLDGMIMVFGSRPELLA